MFPALIVICQPLPRIEFIFPNSYVTLVVAVYIHSFNQHCRLLSTKLFNQGFRKSCLILRQEGINTLLKKYSVTCVQMTKDSIDNSMFGFKFSIVSVFFLTMILFTIKYLNNSWGYDIWHLCVTKMKYTMHNNQD